MIKNLTTSFRTLNYSFLEVLMKEDIFYMGVPKSIFIARFKERVEWYCEELPKIYDDVILFDLKIITGGSQQQSFAFVSEHLPTLKLCITYKNEEIENIQLDSSLKVKEDPHEGDWNFFMRFYEDEKVSFIPNEHYYQITERVGRAMSHFNMLVNDFIIIIEDLKTWMSSLEKLIEDTEVGCPFSFPKYSTIKPFETLYYQVKNFLESEQSVKKGYFKLAKNSNITVECIV